jgi:hypothetical protein
MLDIPLMGFCAVPVGQNRTRALRGTLLFVGHPLMLQELGQTARSFAADCDLVWETSLQDKGAW